MAGTITVGELLSDATSSNKILIGSGTTLDLKASAGTTTMPTGSVLQVVMDSSTTQETSTATSWTDSALSLSITPSSTSSKILVLSSFTGRTNTANKSAYFSIFKDSTNLGNSTDGFVRLETGGSLMTSVQMTILDSPSTISATTYKMRYAAQSGTTLYAMMAGTYGSIIAIEIGA